VESTVIDLTGPTPRVLRPGGVPVEALAAVLGMDPLEAAPVDTSLPMPSPGLLERHYSPRAPLTVYEGDAVQVMVALRSALAGAARAGHRVGLLLMDEDQAHALPGEVRTLGPLANMDAVAANLYAALRELDAAGVDLILAHGVGDARGVGAAVRDRLRRAAAGRVVQC
jgi:L-threonylcarbamoyladenylate synthase